MSKKNILMIGTGGTIASQKTAHGLAPGLTIKSLLQYIPQVQAWCNIETIQPFSLDSTNMTPYHWSILSREIERYYDDFDGFVICHGTDTMAYTAAALSYMVQNSPKPIVLTGAQKPIDLPDTDARINLMDSFLYACDEQSHEVSIVFNGKVIVGTRAKKERAKSYHAFSSINFPYPAIIQDHRVIRYFDTCKHCHHAHFYHQLHDDVCTLKLIPGTKPAFLSYLFEHYSCIILESFGVGGIPASLLDTFYQEMNRFQHQKTIIMTTQVAYEGSNMNVYEVGRRMKQDFEILEAYDMTLEAIVTKMMWILGTGAKTSSEIKDLFYEQINHDILFS